MLVFGGCSEERTAGPGTFEQETLGAVPEAMDIGDGAGGPKAADIEEFQFDDPEFPLRRRIRGLLEAYAGACESRNISAYDECLSDDFLFVFLLDVADEIGLPPEAPWWGKTEDLASMQNLFQDPNVTSITFNYQVLPVYSRMDPAGPVAALRIEPDIRVVIELPGQEPIIFWVNSTYLDLKFVRDLANLWVLLEMEEVYKNPARAGSDEPGDVATEPSGFSHIKAMFR
jgi:hypothetical protein